MRLRAADMSSALQYPRLHFFSRNGWPMTTITTLSSLLKISTSPPCNHTLLPLFLLVTVQPRLFLSLGSGPEWLVYKCTWTSIRHTDVYKVDMCMCTCLLVITSV